jgi:LysM repeat protein
MEEIMRSIFRLPIVILIVALVAAGPIGWVTARSIHPQSGELLANPDFEDPFVQEGLADLFVANSWLPWYVVPDGVTYPTKCAGSDANCKPYAVPVYHPSQPQNAKVPPRAISGNSQQWGTAYAVYIAGVYQQVGNITPGTQLRFSAYTQGFNCDDDRGCFGPSGRYGYSYEPGNMQMRVGIDPTGGTNAFASTVVWSSFVNPLDAFVQQQVDAVAQSDKVTVFVWSSPTYPEKHTEVYVDSASLVALGQGAVPTGVPTQTAQPTPVSGTVIPTATISPDAKTYTIVAGDTLSAIAQRFNLTLDQLLALNPTLTRESVINIGQVINIAGTPPTPGAVTATAPAATAPVATATTAPTTTPQPSPTGVPTMTPTPAAAATATPATATPASTTPVTTTAVTSTMPAPANVALSSGLCLQAFDDLNSNLTRDPNEALVAGVVFNVKSVDGATSVDYTTDGQREPHCFTTLPDGRYAVNTQLPADRVATTDSAWQMSLLADTNVNIVLGTHLDVPPTVAPTLGPTPVPATPAPKPAATTSASSLALLGGGVLVLFAGVILFLGLRSRKKQ